MQRLKATQPEKKSYKTEDSNYLKSCFVLISKCFSMTLVDVWWVVKSFVVLLNVLLLGIFVCSQSGNHPYKDVEKKRRLSVRRFSQI
jgi:hypothetical protein